MNFSLHRSLEMHAAQHGHLELANSVGCEDGVSRLSRKQLLLGVLVFGVLVDPRGSSRSEKHLRMSKTN